MYTWFDIINKPLYTPPAIVFKTIWPILYFLLFISLITFYRSKTKYENKILPLTLFFAQLILNLSWPAIFFINHNITLALLVIFLIIILLIMTILQFYKFSKLSALLLCPYLLWLLFAGYLTYEILILNK